MKRIYENPFLSTDHIIREGAIQECLNYYSITATSTKDKLKLKFNFLQKVKAVTIGALVMLFMGPLAQAETKTATNGNWATPDTWSPSGVPLSTDEVIIPSGITVNMNTSFTLSVGHTITINGSGKIFFSKDNPGLLTINGTIIFNGVTSTAIDAATGGSTTRYFILNNGATLITANTNGITTGTNSSIVSGVNKFIVTLNNGANYEFQGANQIMTGLPFTGLNNLTLSGSGTKTLTGSSSMNGTLTVNAGVTLALSNYTLGSPVNTFLYCGGSAGSVISGTNNLTLNGNLSVLYTGTGTGGATISCPVSLGNSSRTFSVANNGSSATDLTISGVLSGTEGIIKDGTGTMLLSASNNYSGATTINEGTLRAGASPNAFGSCSAVILADIAGAILDINDYNTSIGSLTGGGDTGGNITLGSATLTIGCNNTSPAAYGGVISGTGQIIKTGTGTLTLSGYSTFTGLTTIGSGIIKLEAGFNDSSNGPLGKNLPGGGTLVSTNATLDLYGQDLSGYPEPLILNGTGVSNGGTLINSSTLEAFYSGDILLETSSSIGTAGNITIAGVISGSQTLTKVGSGALILSGSNTFSEGLIVNAGLLELGNSDCLVDVLPITLNGGTLSTGSTSGFSETVGVLDLLNSSTIALGSGVHSLTFASSETIPWDGLALTITGWVGTSGMSGSAGQIFVGVGGLSTEQLAKISFSGYGTGVQILSTGELVPVPTSNDFRSQINGDWDQPTTWEVFTGGQWIDATSAPTSTNSGVISIFHEVVIPINFNATASQLIVGEEGELTVETNPDVSLEVDQITLNGILTVNEQGRVTVSTLANNGTLNLESGTFGTASLIVDSYEDHGTEKIELYLSSGGSSSNAWHYISSPVKSLSTDIFTSTTLDLAQFVEDLPKSGEAPYSWQRGWIAYDGWSYETENYEGYAGFTTLDPGKGYNYWYYENETYEISGDINTSDPAPVIEYSGDPEWSGYNLLGNPYTCGLDIDYMFDNSWPSGTFSAVYFTKDGVTYVYGGGIGVPVSAEEGFIPPMQGFFVRTTEPGTFHFPEEAKVHTSVQRYKGDKKSIPLIRLSTTENEKSEETVVRFDNMAKEGFDLEFDAPRFISSTTGPSIYTSVDNKEYTINGQPFPADSIIIPVTVKYVSDGTHTISVMQVQELKSYGVTLTDRKTGSVVDLKSAKEYKFTSEKGVIEDRFVLTVTNISTGIIDPLRPENPFTIYTGFDFINILPLGDEWDGTTGMVKIMDFSGRPVRYQNNTEFNKNSLIQIPAPEKGGLYFVEIRSGLMKFVGKVVVK